MRCLWLVLMTLSLPACSQWQFYTQAISGHANIMHARQAITSLIAAAETSAELRKKLELTQLAKAFAVRELALPDNASYTTYVELQREYVSWTVIATPEFSVEPVTWCFLWVGCLPYRGYFNEQQAVDFAAELRAQHQDVYVAGATAYSTLGWFADPVVSSMLSWSDTRLIGVIFHELAHQQVWLPGNASFNEAFAVFVEQAGVRRWLQQYQTPAELQDYELSLQRQTEFTFSLQATRQQLAELYASTLPDAEKRRAKQDIFASWREHYFTEIKSSWQFYSGYDSWFDEELNNARFALVATYFHYLPAFETLFEQQQHNFPAFYAAVTALGKLPEAQRLQQIQQLLQASTATE